MLRGQSITANRVVESHLIQSTRWHVYAKPARNDTEPYWHQLEARLSREYSLGDD